MASLFDRSPRPGIRAGSLAAAIACAALALAPTPAAAGAHSARLSADLTDHLAAGSQTIRVIVHGTRAEVDALAARYNLQIAKYLQSGAVFQVNAGQLAAMRQDEGLDHLSGDLKIQSSVAAADVETVGADQVWLGTEEGRAQTGRGVTVAVIDSGINTRHNALRGRVLVTRDFTGGDGQDRYGHGTHVAAIIAGQAGRTADTKDYRGIAPGAYLLNLRVLGDDGSGTVSDVIDAIDWTIVHQHEYNVRVINLSLGAPVLQPYRDDPLCEAVERAVRAGLVVVVAAGNYGKTADGRSVYGAITSPANSPYAIAVGAVDTHDTAQRSDDTVASYSSKGPTRYDLVMKPDLAAPGSHIRSAEAADSYLARTYPARHVSGSGANGVIQLSGTSQAAGFVSGAAALVLDARGSLRPVEIKAALQLTSTFMPDAGIVGAGAGLINALAAVRLAETNEVPSATTIAGENVVASGLFSTTMSTRVAASLSQRSSVQITTVANGRNTNVRFIMWRTSIMWGTANAQVSPIGGQTIVWGTYVDGNTIVWGTSADGDTIVWGTSTDGDTIVWGTATDGDTIVWGTTTDGDTIVWGTSVDGEFD
ncbi:MAG: aprX 2 [Acidobacteria bacterium]|nr:aprX 2 [Acidobacteriota bacterium]